MRDNLARAMTRAVGDVLTVDNKRWRVERARGVTCFVVRDGTKGRKLYTLVATDLELETVDVVEVWPGSGESKGLPAVASGRIS